MVTTYSTSTCRSTGSRWAGDSTEGLSSSTLALMSSTTNRPRECLPSMFACCSREGEKNRAITATFGVPIVASASATYDPTAGPETRGPASAAAPALAWVLGGIGVAGLGTSLAFLIAQDVEFNHLKSTCGASAQGCTDSQISPVSTERTIAWVAVGVGGASLVAATCIFLVHRSGASATRQPAASIVFDVTPMPHGGAGAIVGQF